MVALQRVRDSLAGGKCLTKIPWFRSTTVVFVIAFSV